MQRAHARHELVERERLREVVVRPGVEAGHAVVDRVARREHEDRRPHALVAETAADLEAVAAREHDVEEDRVVRRRHRHPERVLPAPGDVRGVALLAQAAGEQVRELLLVLDHEHAHGSIVLASG